MQHSKSYAALTYFILLAASLITDSNIRTAIAGGGGPLRVEFSTDGGIAFFPGLSRPVVIEAHQLTPAEFSELKYLIEVTRFFNLPDKVGTPPRGAADYHSYTITIEDDGLRHTLKANDFVEDPNLQQLIAFLRNKARALGRKSGGGPTPP